MRGVIAAGLMMIAAPAMAQAPSQVATDAWATKDVVTIAIAAIGAVLGILNYWNTISARRLNVKVTPAHAIGFGALAEESLFMISVVNLSLFPITVAEVGVTLRGAKSKRMPVVDPMMRVSVRLPHRLESRMAASVYFSPIAFARVSSSINGAYARLDSGEIVTGNSPALKEVAEMLTRAQRSG